MFRFRFAVEKWSMKRIGFISNVRKARKHIEKIAAARVTHDIGHHRDSIYTDWTGLLECKDRSSSSSVDIYVQILWSDLERALRNKAEIERWLGRVIAIKIL